MSRRRYTSATCCTHPREDPVSTGTTPRKRAVQGQAVASMYLQYTVRIHVQWKCILQRSIVSVQCTGGYDVWSLKMTAKEGLSGEQKNRWADNDPDVGNLIQFRGTGRPRPGTPGDLDVFVPHLGMYKSTYLLRVARILPKLEGEEDITSYLRKDMPDWPVARPHPTPLRPGGASLPSVGQGSM